MKFLLCLPFFLMASTPAGSNESLTIQVSPRNSWLPGGEYRVTASLFDSRGDRRARVQQQVMVLATNVAR